MKLDQFIRTNMEALLEDWEEALLKIAPDLMGEDRVALRDHAREMLTFISQDILTSQTKQEAADKALGLSKAIVSGAGGEHGAERHRQGLSIHQMTLELRALRARVTLAWSNEQGSLTTNDIGELVRFNESIDQLIATSMSSFTALQGQGIRLIETMLNASPDPAAIFDPDGKVLFLNTVMADLLGSKPQDVVGKTSRELGLEYAAEEITTTVVTGLLQRREYSHCFPSGQKVYFECQYVPVFDDQNQVEAVVETTWNITERKQNEQQIWHSANFDDLTGIPNRRLFLDRLEQNLREAQRKESPFALLFIDLDRFKQANDQLGHETGDRLLAQVAERISTSVRAMDTVARLGGDEFTMILKEADRESAIHTAKALLTSLEVAFEVDSHRVHISGSIGITVFPDDGNNVGQLMHNADQAMYAAKEGGGHQVKIYEPWMTKIESEHMRLNRELDNALEKNQLEVYYQPIVDTQTRAVVRAEALLRWRHPEKGLLTPDAFLNATEQNDMTDSIANYVREQAALCSSRWCAVSGEKFPISVNESPASFSTRNLVDHWRAKRGQISLDDSSITMELTPASFNNIRASGLNLVNCLSSSGPRIKLAIDGFGIELFSLLALQETDLEFVKIDRELIKEAGQGGGSDYVLEGIITMAHAINIQVVGVGVERNEQLQLLSRIGCDYAQGFLFSKPIPQDDFEVLLKQNRQKVLSNSLSV